MWPWGHLAVGYLLYTAGLRRFGRQPQSPEVYLLALGTQLPDLVDKPLAWTFDVLVSGRSLGHSLLVATVVIAVLFAVLAPRVERGWLAAFAVGYLSHPLADFPFEDVLAGDWTTVAFYVWPLRSMPPDDPALTILGYFLAFEIGPFDYVQFGLVVVAAWAWHRDGRPGLPRRPDRPGSRE